MAATSLGKPGVVRSMPRRTPSPRGEAPRLQPSLRAPARWIPIACGVDVVDIDRFRRLLGLRGKRFLERVFTKNELLDCGSSIERLASRFAAKEAMVKALGCGVGPVGWRELETCRDHRDKPYVRLHGRAAAKARDQGLIGWSLTLSHTSTVAVAFVVAAKLPMRVGDTILERRG